MLSDVGDRAGEFRLSSVYERVRFFDECMAREEASMGDMLTVKETATAVPRPVQATGSRPDRPRDRQQEPFDEAIQGELLPPQRPVSPKTARVRTQPIPQAPPNTKKRRVNLTGLRQPKFKRARLAKSSVEKQNDDGDGSTRDWAVAKITGHEETRYGCRYRVAWENTWEPEDCLENAQFKIEEYWDQYYERSSPQ